MIEPATPLLQGLERGRLRQHRDSREGQRGAVSVLPVRDPADRVAEDLDRRLWHMLVVVCRAGLPPILLLPSLLLARLDVQSGFHAGEFAERIGTARLHRHPRGRRIEWVAKWRAWISALVRSCRPAISR